jgi:hypothetical protein
VDIHVSTSMSPEMLAESWYVKDNRMPGRQVTRLRPGKWPGCGQASGQAEARQVTRLRPVRSTVGLCAGQSCDFAWMKSRMKATMLKSGTSLTLGLRGPPLHKSPILSPLTQDLPDKLDTD